MRYYGCKTKLLDFIEKSTQELDLYEGAKFFDMFTGTTAVAKHFKRLGYTVIANDNLEFCHALAKTYIELNEHPKFNKLKKVVGDYASQDTHDRVVGHLNTIEPTEEFVFKNYCPGGTKNLRTYFSDENGKKIDAIRMQIHEWKKTNLVTELEYYYLLAALIEGVNLVSNVAGTYAACLKTWDKRALKPLLLTSPEVIPSKRVNKALRMDANEAVEKISTDILYLDPPYNTRQFASNYFLLELIAEGWFDKEPVIDPKSKTGIYFDESKKSLYCQKATAPEVFADLIKKAKARHILLSYNNEGIISEKHIQKTLSEKGELVRREQNHKRYRSINQTEDDPDSVNERLYVVSVNGVKDRFNRLNGAKWLQHSFSIWRDTSKNTEELALDHPAIFPISLAERLIDIFTDKKDVVVLDPMVGSGSVVIAALKRGRKAVGLDLNREYIQLAKQRLTTNYKEFDDKKRYKLLVGDALDLHKYVEPNSVRLCVTSPPYWDILNEKRTADQKENVNYSESKKDLGNLHDYNQFLDSLKSVYAKVYESLQNNGFCAVIVMDIRKKSNFYPFHSDLANKLTDIGFKLRDIIIWDRQKEYNNLKPLGYPYSFIVNKVHEYVLIFEKSNGQIK
jgi:adenine-specific DNA methylase